MSDRELALAIKRMTREVDDFNWYWYSYGEKCYAFAVAMCITLDEADAGSEPLAGSRLWLDGDGNLAGKNASGDIVKMYEYESIATIERQDGGAICQFIANAHASLIAEKDIDGGPVASEHECIESDDQFLRELAHKAARQRRLMNRSQSKGSSDER